MSYLKIYFDFKSYSCQKKVVLQMYLHYFKIKETILIIMKIHVLSEYNELFRMILCIQTTDI